ncbi:MAG: hypothetical protein ACI837_001616 [Crocinitomicaceae bacterium]|jgi:hypothetical protein
MKRFGFLFSVLFLVLLSACTSDDRNKIVGGELTVYFIDKQDESLAKEVALYWKEHDLVTGKPQDLELSKAENGYVLAMIAKKPNELDLMTFTEKRLLNELKMDLYETIFEEKPFNLVLSNPKFETLYVIGQ